jgi:PAS domain S-box-containing protein
MTLVKLQRTANDSNGTSAAADLAATIVNSSFDAIFSQTLDGRITSWNPAATALFGYRPEEMIGASVRRLIPSGRQDEEDRNLAKVKAGERVESYVTVRLDKEQRSIDISLTISPIWDQNGEIIGASKIVRAIASQRDALEALRWRQFVAEVPVGILMLDRNLVHLACSRRWVETHGVEAGIGRYHYDLFPQAPEHWREAHRRGLAGETVCADGEEFVRLDGGKQWVRWEVRPWLTAEGTIGGITIMSEDVTDRVLAAQALRESEMRMRLAQEAAKAGVWEWRPSDNSVQWSDSLWSLYGVPKPEDWKPTSQAWLSLLHPADKERVTTLLREAAGLARPVEFQWRFNVPEGKPERWFLSRGRPIAGENGALDRYFGVVIDTTKQKQMEAALRESQDIQGFLLSLNDTLRSIDEPAEAIAIAAKMLGQKLNASQVVYCKTDALEERASIAHVWNDGVLPDTFAVDRLDDFDPLFLEDLENGQTVVVGDTRSDPRSNRPEVLALLERGAVAAFIVVPFVKDRRIAGFLGVHKRDPYPWRKNEVALAQDVAHRTWDSVERALAVRALRESEDRQSFLLSLNDALRSVDDPFEAIATASKMLGQKLNAAQVVYVNAVETGRGSVTHEWNDGAVSGPFAIERLNDFAPSLIEDLRNGQTVAISDIRLDPRTCDPEAIAIFERGSIAAVTTVPFIKNGWLAGGLGVHKRTPHGWKTQEIALAREVAERIWEAAERALAVQALRESEERQSFLLALNDALRTVDDPLEAIAIASDMLGQKLNASRVVYAKTGEAGERPSITHEWNDGVAPGALAIVGINDFAASLIEDLETSQAILVNGQAVAVGDARLEPRSRSPKAMAIFERGSVAAFITVPFIKNCRLAAALAVHKRTPYAWKTEEIALAQEVAQRTWEAVERAHVSQALRESEERQSFLLALNDALRTVDDPFEAIAIASRMLGQKLKAAQVMYAKTGETGDRAGITHKWNDGVASGDFAIESVNDYAASLIDDLVNGRTVVVSDVRLDPRSFAPEAQAIFERGSIAAFINVPFIKNRRLAGGLAVHKRTPHAWKTEEIALVQEVAERTWDAVERAHVAQALRDSEDRLKFALEAASVGSWEMSLEARKFTASDQALAFFDFLPGTQPSYEEVIALIHADDQLAVNEALRRTAETGQPLRIEFRRLALDGSVRWFDARAERRTVAGRQVMGGLIQDTTGRVKQKEAAEKAARAKAEFLSNMSHELRTPMHAILSYSDMGLIVLSESKTEAVKAYLGNIKTAGSRLLGLLNDLLDLSKMQSGKMIYKRADANLTDVIRHALMEVEPLLAQKRIVVQQDVQAGSALVHIDRSRLIQVFVNLLSNAIRFSETGKKISIGASRLLAGDGAEVLRCHVADEGPGIPEGELQSIFEKFVQSSKTKTGAGGTGLGLPICREIMEAHGGAIWAENIEPHGAAFVFDIPL